MTGPRRARPGPGIAASLLLACVAAAQLAPTAAERAFVADLDRAWSTGKAAAVARRFSFLHPQARNALIAHVLHTTGGEMAAACDRQSEVRRVFEFERDDGRTQRALLLEASISTRVKSAVKGRFFEVLVFHPRRDGEPLAGVLLVETTPSNQMHVGPGFVTPMPDPKDPDCGRPIGRDLYSRCPACNYRVGAPKSGNWAVIARPSSRTNCLVGVEVYSLDEDLAMDLAIEVAGDRSPPPLDQVLLRTRANVAAQYGVDVEPAEPRPVDKPALTGYETRLVVAGTRPRAFEIYGYRYGAATYVLSVQGPAALLERRADRVRALLATFQVFDPSRPVDPAVVAGAYGRAAEFAGGAFRVPSLGLSIRAPFGDWPHTESPGATSFQAVWSCPRTGSSMVCAGIERPEAAWTMRGTKAWLAQWVRQSSGPAGLPGLTTRGAPARIRVAGRDAWLLRFHFRWNEGGQVEGFLLAVPAGHTLVSVQGRARPGPQQQEIQTGLLAAARSLRLD